MNRKVLILGGYGNFGKMISKGLLKYNIPIIIAGRNNNKLNQFHQHLTQLFPTSLIGTAQIDANYDLGQYFLKQKPKLVINTCGPFQPIQSTNFNIVKQCISNAIHYIDLADGRDFVNSINQFNQQAIRADTTVITGASTAPGLSSAILDKYIPQFNHIQSVRYGFSPGQRSTRGGEATARGVMSYVGKLIKPYGAFSKPSYGWQNIYAQLYPGLGYRLMGNVDHPDLDIFPKKYGIGNIRFSAGVQSKLLHISIWITSWIVRLGFNIDLVKHSDKLLNISHYLFDWMGTEVGVMHMKIKGTNKQGKKIQRTWFLVADKGDGPNVATVPAIILGKKIFNNQLKLPGVHPCVSLIELDEYIDYLKQFNIKTFVKQIELK